MLYQYLVSVNFGYFLWDYTANFWIILLWDDAARRTPKSQGQESTKLRVHQHVAPFFFFRKLIKKIHRLHIHYQPSVPPRLWRVLLVQTWWQTVTATGVQCELMAMFSKTSYKVVQWAHKGIWLTTTTRSFMAFNHAQLLLKGPTCDSIQCDKIRQCFHWIRVDGPLRH